MSGLVHLRLAALCALAYGLLLASGLLHAFQRTGSLRALMRGLGHPWFWGVLLVAVLAMFGLWLRQAWAWWLAVAAALFQLGRIVTAYVQGPAFGRTPAPSTVIALVLLVAIVLLLAPRSARLAANR
jgi:hypothetical protein